MKTNVHAFFFTFKMVLFLRRVSVFMWLVFGLSVVLCIVSVFNNVILNFPWSGVILFSLISANVLWFCSNIFFRRLTPMLERMSRVNTMKALELCCKYDRSLSSSILHLSISGDIQSFLLHPPGYS